MATPYQNVAKAALINWNGLSEDEAISKINNESISELESQVYAMSSMKYAVIGISKQIGLSEEETTKFFDAVINGPENAEIFNTVKAKSKDFSEEKQLGVLSTIHDGWVIDNSNEKTFNKKCDRKQLRQYAPLELIGWNEVKSDLLFLNPILKSIDVNVNEKNLEQSYHNRVANYIFCTGFSGFFLFALIFYSFLILKIHIIPLRHTDPQTSIATGSKMRQSDKQRPTFQMSQ